MNENNNLKPLHQLLNTTHKKHNTVYLLILPPPPPSTHNKNSNGGRGGRAEFPSTTTPARRHKHPCSGTDGGWGRPPPRRLKTSFLSWVCGELPPTPGNATPGKWRHRRRRWGCVRQGWIPAIWGHECMVVFGLMRGHNEQHTMT